VLEGVQAEVGEVADRLTRRVDAEDAARLLQRVVIGGIGAVSARGHALMIARVLGDPCNPGEVRAQAGVRSVNR
jgi:hypothetical protein